jgi:hypothetical protein
MLEVFAADFQYGGLRAQDATTAVQVVQDMWFHHNF